MSAPVKQDAAFRWTENGQDHLHYLGAKIRRPTVNPVQQVHRWRSADLTTERVISIGAGVQDLSGTLRFDGSPDSLARFVAAGRRGASLEYFPSLATPSLSFPCVLVEAGEITTDPDLWFDRRHQVDVRLRRIDGGSWQALLEAPLFYWRAGQALQGLTFTRTGIATYTDSDGILQTAAEDVARIDWPMVDGERKPALLLENSGANQVLQSEDFGTTWTVTGTPTRSAAAHTAAGVTLDLIGDDDPATAEYYEQIVTFTGDGSRAVSVFVKQGDTPNPNGSVIIVRDTTASAYRLRATVTWAGGVPSVSIAEGAEVRAPEEFADGVYRLHLRAAAVVAANTNRVRVYPATETASETGDVYAGGVQAENRTVPSSYIRTTTAPGQRNAETFFADFPHAPQEMTVLAEFEEIGAILTNQARIFHIGSATGSADPRFSALANSGDYATEHDNGTTSPVATLATAPSIGDIVELRSVLRTDGSVATGQSIDGASETTASTATTADLGDAWADARIYFNSRGTSNREAVRLFSLKVMPGVRSLAEMRAA
jgi:hypothetical protein